MALKDTLVRAPLAFPPSPVIMERGRILMERIRVLVGEMREIEEKLLIQRKQTASFEGSKKPPPAMAGRGFLHTGERPGGGAHSLVLRLILTAPP